MPGKHAPASSRSFLVSVARAAAAVLAALGLVSGVALLAVRSGSRPAPVTRPTPSPTVSISESPAAQITVEVLNGAGRKGLATRATDQLRAAGWAVAKPGDAKPAAVTTIYYLTGYLEAAQALQTAFPTFGRVLPAVGKQMAELRVVLGADYP